MAYNSSYTGPEIDSAIGAVKNKEKTWDSKQDKLNGTEDQLVGFNSAGDAVAVAAPATGVTSFKGRTGAVTPQNGDYTAEMVGAAPAIVLRTATLTTSGWSSNSQTVTVTGVVANNNAQAIDVSPLSKTDADNWAQAGVWCTAQGANTLTFTCTEVPSANINVNVKIQEV